VYSKILFANFGYTLLHESNSKNFVVKEFKSPDTFLQFCFHFVCVCVCVLSYDDMNLHTDYNISMQSALHLGLLTAIMT
jgi:hypothetical protein